eukprot:9327599-Alexandrium_andersonii.AAC.1
MRARHARTCTRACAGASAPNALPARCVPVHTVMQACWRPASSAVSLAPCQQRGFTGAFSAPAL